MKPAVRKNSGMQAVITGTEGIRDRMLPFTFLLPSLAFICFIIIYPLFTGFFYSLKNGTMLQEGTFTGIENYMRLVQLPEFWEAIRFSLIFALFSVAGSYVIGLGLALLLNMDIPGRNFFRASLLIPWIIPSIVSIVCWRWMLSGEQSIANLILGWFGIKPVLFLADKTWAVISVCIVKIWRSFPFMMVSCLAALQSISGDLYEAAYIDGATRWKSFRYVTLPHLMPISVVCWILMTIWSFNDFDTIWLLTEGGPLNATRNLIVLAYRYSFSKNDIGMGSAMSIVALIVLMVMANFVLKKQTENQ